MMETPEQPEGEAPEEETPEGVPGEADEHTPSEPDELVDAEPADLETPGPEIEGAEELEGEQPEGEQGDAEQGPAAEGSDASAEQPPGEQRPRPRDGDRAKGGDQEEVVIPGAHLEPDLVLEEQRPEGEYGEYGEYADADADADEDDGGEEGAEPALVAHTPLELAADARYNATGKRKSAIARVILKPGEGTYTINGRHLDEYFPRVRLQRMATQPLEAAGYHTRMDVVARIHGGGVSAQANALRHGIARALVEADPALRAELKRRGYLTRDPREKERKKAGLKKARKRPQFSKR
jgi:small subunit ribosomal protein S9